MPTTAEKNFCAALKRLSNRELVRVLKFTKSVSGFYDLREEIHRETARRRGQQLPPYDWSECPDLDDPQRARALAGLCAGPLRCLFEALAELLVERRRSALAAPAIQERPLDADARPQDTPR